LSAPVFDRSSSILPIPFCAGRARRNSRFSAPRPRRRRIPQVRNRTTPHAVGGRDATSRSARLRPGAAVA